MHRVPLVLGALVLASAAIAEQRWPTVTIDHVAQVAMPNQPRHEVEPATFSDGGNSDHNQHIYTVDEPNSRYVVNTGVYPANARTVDAWTTLQRYVDGPVHDSQIKWQTVRRTTHYDAPAVEAIGNRRDGKVFRIFVLLAGNRYIYLAYTGPAGTEKNSFVNLFFQSLLPKSRNYWQPCTAETTCVD